MIGSYACHSTGTLDGALLILKTQSISAAILDVNIQGAAVFSVAREVRAQGAPCVFTTYNVDDVIVSGVRGESGIPHTPRLRACLRRSCFAKVSPALLPCCHATPVTGSSSPWSFSFPKYAIHAAVTASRKLLMGCSARARMPTPALFMF